MIRPQKITTRSRSTTQTEFRCARGSRASARDRSCGNFTTRSYSQPAASNETSNWVVRIRFARTPRTTAETTTISRAAAASNQTASYPRAATATAAAAFGAASTQPSATATAAPTASFGCRGRSCGRQCSWPITSASVGCASSMHDRNAQCRSEMGSAILGG